MASLHQAPGQQPLLRTQRHDTWKRRHQHGDSCNSCCSAAHAPHIHTYTRLCTPSFHYPSQSSQPALARLLEDRKPLPTPPQCPEAYESDGCGHSPIGGRPAPVVLCLHLQGALLGHQPPWPHLSTVGEGTPHSCRFGV